MAAAGPLVSLIQAIAHDERVVADELLREVPGLGRVQLERREEFFVTVCHAQVYAGDTALHAAAFAYDLRSARRLIAHDADVHARNRRGAQPLHAAAIGVPGSGHWNPGRQRKVIEYLLEVGADPNAAALGGVTPLHRAIRNRCSAAVEALLRGGADPHGANDRGSTAMDLADRTTGRGGSGSIEARTEQRIIVKLLEDVGC